MTSHPRALLLLAMLCVAALPQSIAASDGSLAPAVTPRPHGDVEKVRQSLESGNLAEAERFLLDAVRNGFNDFSRLQREAEFALLRSTTTCRAILADREAADPLLAQGQARVWRDRLTRDGEPRLTDDSHRRIILVTALEPEEHDAAFRSLCDPVDAPWELFTTARSQYVVVVLLPDSAALRYFPNRHVHGRYLHRSRVLLTRGLGRPLHHELAHAWHHQEMDSLGQEHPIWIQEGLACLFESARVSSSGSRSIGANERDPLVKRLVEAQEVLSWQTLLSLSKLSFEADAARSYAQARSIFLFMHERGLLEKWYRIYVHGYASDPTGVKALEQAFNSDLGSIEVLWREWIGSRDVEPLNVHDHGPMVARGDTRTMVVASTAEIHGGDRAAGGIDPGTSNAPWDEARALYERGAYSDATGALQTLLEEHPQHAQARYLLGLSLVRLGHVDAACHEYTLLAEQDRSLASLLANLLRQGEPSPRCP